MAKIRFGYSDDFIAKNNKVGINTTEPQTNLDVVGVVKGQDLKVTGISSFTAYEGFLRSDHQIAENTTLSFDQGPVSSLSGEIIVGTGKTVTVNKVIKETAGVGNNGNTLWHNLVSGGHSGIIDRSPSDKGAFWNGKFFDFDGSNDVILGESCLTLFTDDTDHTIEVWVRFDDVTTRRTIISGYDSNTGTYADRWDIEVSGGKIQGGHHGSGYWTSTASVVTGRWYHLVFVHDHASSLWRVFINTATDVTHSNGGLDLTSDALFGIGDRAESSIGHLDGQISIVRIYSKELSSTEISTNYNLGPFSKDTSVTGNLITHYNASNPSSYPGTIRDVDTTDITTAGGSEIECLKVFNTFTPPSGGTNDRPYAPKPGELYYNYDFKTIEFFDGNGWRQVDYTSRSGRVVIAGGYGPLGAPAGNPGIKSMQSIQVMTLGNTQYFGELNEINTEHIGCGSEIRGVLGGGYVAPARVNIIQYLTIASESNAIDFGNLTQIRNQAMAVSSSTRGIWAGGFGPNLRDEIDYVEISTIGNAIDFGDLTVAKSAGAVGNSPTRGVFISGYRQPQVMDYHKTEYITIASKGNGTDFGESGIIIAGGSCGSNTRGVFGGGYQRNPASNPIKTLSYVTMASFGNTVDFGNLTVDMTYASSGGNSVRGVFTGSDGAPYSNTNIDYVSVTSLGNGQEFGDLSIKTGYAGAVSDSHGGLGGF